MERLKIIFQISLLFVVMLGMSSCGGGGSSGSSPIAAPPITSVNSSPESSSSAQSSSLISSSSFSSSLPLSSSSSAISSVISSSPLSSSNSSKASAVSSSRSPNLYVDSSKQFKLVSNPYTLLSFEDVANWTASTAVIGKSNLALQGMSSLALKKFTKTKLTSRPLNSLRGVGGSISFGLKLDHAQIGSIKLLASIPSLSVLDSEIGSFKLEDVKLGVFNKIEFSIPENLTKFLNNEYNDLVFSFEISGSNEIDELLLDDISFDSVVATNSDKVEIDIQSPDDFLYITVNGVQRKIWSGLEIGDVPTGKVDISAMFWKGANSLQMQAINAAGEKGFLVTLWINGEQVLQKKCLQGSCAPNFDQGIFYQTSFVFNTPNRPVARQLEVTASQAANIYIDDHLISKQATGIYFVPQSSMTVGVGEYTDAPFNYKSKYFEKKISAGIQNERLDTSSAVPLGVQNITRVAVVAIRKTIVSDTPRQGILKDEELARFSKNMQMVSDLWIEPLSYGLSKWQVDVIPTVENVALEMPTLGSGFDGSEFLTKAGLDSLKSQYQIIVFHYPGYDANGVRLDNGGGAGAWAMNGYFYVSDLWSFAEDRPNSVLLHEILHIYEQYQVWKNYTSNGVNGLHGAGNHGYQVSNTMGEEDWVGWYREFIRGTVKENTDVRSNIEISTPVEQQDIFVGVFETFRRGLGFLH